MKLKSLEIHKQKTEVNNRLEDMQRSLAMETEARGKEAQMQISNFYRTGTKK